jgi:hypothetical protein
MKKVINVGIFEHDVVDTRVTQIEHQFMIGPKYYFGLRVQSKCAEIFCLE